MRLLIVTQVIDTEHPILGFFHRWVQEFAKHCEHVHVICLEAGKHSLPANVTVHSLGKEDHQTGGPSLGRSETTSKGGPRVLSNLATKIRYTYRFYKLIWSLRKDYDQVFVHMNQIYVILGAPIWKLLNKKVALWYVHRQVTCSLRLAVLFATKIFSSSPESFRIKTAKVEYIGHGIDFSAYEDNREKIKDSDNFIISHFGRITKIKNIHVLIKAVAASNYKHIININLYGETGTSADKEYKSELEKLATESGVIINFVGAITSNEVPKKVQETDLSVNLTPVGGWDKVVIEAIAGRTPVLTSNTAFADLFGNYADDLLFKFSDVNDLAKKIDEQFGQTIFENNKQAVYLKQRASIYNLANLIPKLLSF